MKDHKLSNALRQTSSEFKGRLGSVANQATELDNSDKLIELTETTKLYYSYSTVVQIIAKGIR